MQYASMGTPLSDRLVAARKLAGFESAADAARALSVPEPTYLAHENGSRGFRAKAEKYARRFGVSLEWLLTGRGEMVGPAASEDEREMLDLYRRVPDHAQKTVLDFLRGSQKIEGSSKP